MLSDYLENEWDFLLKVLGAEEVSFFQELYYFLCV